MSKTPSRKTRKLDVSPFVAELNNGYKEEEFVKKLKCAFAGRSHFAEGNKLVLHNEPFTCCCMPDFLEKEEFLVELKDELLNLEYFEKNNDLYKFHQSDDLKKANSPYIVALRKFVYGDFRDWMQEVTGLTLATTVDMSCARYDHTDILLCHDDMLEGRRIAYILYLVPPWKESDGGALDLFSIDERGDPAKVVKSITPQWNSFVFFEVNHKSYHQVAEVLTEDKTRLSISGWFYGDPVEYPSKSLELPPAMLQPSWLDEEEILEWINPLYLETETQMEIRQTFQEDSEIELVEFLNEDKYKEIAEALLKSGINWKMQGPPNKKMYEIGESSSLPPVLEKCMQFMRSEAMFLILSNLTGLTLHELAMASDSDDSDSENEPDAEEGADRSPEEDDDDVKAGERQPKKKTKKAVVAATTNSGAGVESVKTGNKNGGASKCTFTDEDGDGEPAAKRKKSSTKRDGPEDSKAGGDKPRNHTCSQELRRWRHGSYTMLHDGEHRPVEFALDATLFFNCEDWTNECGGYTSYLTEDENEELLTVYPSANALALVFRDKKTLRFIKHVNHKVNKLEKSSEFHALSSVFYE